MNLHTKVVVSVALPLLLMLSALSAVHYWHEYQLTKYNVHLTALQLGEVMRDSLRQAMLANDHDLLARMLSDIGRMESVQHAQVINRDGQVRADSLGVDLGVTRLPDDPECKECHQSRLSARPRVITLPATGDVFRTCTPIANEPACAGCHPQEVSYLGVLLVDVSLPVTGKGLYGHLQIELLISCGIIILVTLTLYLLVDGLIVRRVKSFRHPLTKFAAGDLTLRLPVSPSRTDELDDLAKAFNHTVTELESHIRQREQLDALRQQAIAEERARIARELHDGLAQFLGYINTKTAAAQLMLKKHQVETANEYLLQMEESVRNMSLDVREVILSFKTAGQIGSGLNITLQDFISQFQRLSGIPVEVVLPPDIENLPLASEVELQLLCIVQEALANIRKHASANKAWVNLQMDGQALELTVGDNGKGFDGKSMHADHQPHFGLWTMRERAEAIGAEFSLNSRPGDGTRITVRLAIMER